MLAIYVLRLARHAEPQSAELAELLACELTAARPMLLPAAVGVPPTSIPSAAAQTILPAPDDTDAEPDGVPPW